MSDEGAPPPKKPRSDFEEPSSPSLLDKADQKIATLEAEVASLRDCLRQVQDDATTLYASGRHCMSTVLADAMQPQGMSANHAKEMIVQVGSFLFALPCLPLPCLGPLCRVFWYHTCVPYVRALLCFFDIVSTFEESHMLVITYHIFLVSILLVPKGRATRLQAAPQHI